jgi:hypothetical protein
MENQENEMEKDEVINPEQFQVGRAPEEEKNIAQDDTTYTPGEVQFADGEGTQLAEEFEDPNEQDLDDEEFIEDEDEFSEEE